MGENIWQYRGSESGVLPVSMTAMIYNRIPPSWSTDRSCDLPIAMRPKCASPLVAGVFDENIKVLGEHDVEIALGNAWEEMLEDVGALGCVLTVTPNRLAVLGTVREFPELKERCRGILYDVEFGSLSIDPRQLHSAVAKQIGRDVGATYAVEFYDRSRCSLLKVCLTSDSCLPSFQEWVQAHQSLGADANLKGSRLSYVDHATCPDGGLVSKEQFEKLLRVWMECSLPVHVTVGNAGAVQSTVMTMNMVRDMGHWLFLSDQDSGLHLCLNEMRRIVSVSSNDTGRCLPGLYLEGDDGRLVCRFEPAELSGIQAWTHQLSHICVD